MAFSWGSLPWGQILMGAGALAGGLAGSKKPQTESRPQPYWSEDISTAHPAVIPSLQQMLGLSADEFNRLERERRPPPMRGQQTYQGVDIGSLDFGGPSETTRSVAEYMANRAMGGSPFMDSAQQALLGMMGGQAGGINNPYLDATFRAAGERNPLVDEAFGRSSQNPWERDYRDFMGRVQGSQSAGLGLPGTLSPPGYLYGDAALTDPNSLPSYGYDQSAPSATRGVEAGKQYAEETDPYLARGRGWASSQKAPQFQKSFANPFDYQRQQAALDAERAGGDPTLAARSVGPPRGGGASGYPGAGRGGYQAPMNMGSLYDQSVQSILAGDYLDPSKNEGLTRYLDLLQSESAESHRQMTEDLAQQAAGVGMYGSTVYDRRRANADEEAFEALDQAMAQALMGAYGQERGIMSDTLQGLGGRLTAQEQIAAQERIAEENRQAARAAASASGAAARAAASKQEDLLRLQLAAQRDSQLRDLAQQRLLFGHQLGFDRQALELEALQGASGNTLAGNAQMGQLAGLDVNRQLGGLGVMGDMAGLFGQQELGSRELGSQMALGALGLAPSFEQAGWYGLESALQGGLGVDTLSTQAARDRAAAAMQQNASRNAFNAQAANRSWADQMAQWEWSQQARGGDIDDLIRRSLPLIGAYGQTSSTHGMGPPQYGLVPQGGGWEGALAGALEGAAAFGGLAGIFGQGSPRGYL